MAHSPVTYDKGTRFTNYSSIHSADAFVGDYQVMYTPGASPQLARASKKATRFSRATSSSKPQQNISQSYLLPMNMPNTSQIMPDHGPLPNIQVHYNIPADEKQIVASLRSLQRDLAEAMQTINGLTKERDDAVHELHLLRATSRRPSSPPKRQVQSIEHELFDLSSPLHESPKGPVMTNAYSKKASNDQNKASNSDNARVLSPLPINTLVSEQPDKRGLGKNARESSKQYRRPVVDDFEQSVLLDPTAASNTSRRRRRPSNDENMTSAYILPDITMEEQELAPPARVSRDAQNVIHNLEPEHIAKCEVCQRLTTNIRATTDGRKVSKKTGQKGVQLQPAVEKNSKPDYTAALAGFVDESLLQDTTMRPKISPVQALTRVRSLMNAQFIRAKERHHDAWIKYDKIPAPTSSKKHAEISKELQYWAEKMEECRVHLDYLRDVEEGMEEA